MKKCNVESGNSEDGDNNLSEKSIKVKGDPCTYRFRNIGPCQCRSIALAIKAHQDAAESKK